MPETVDTRMTGATFDLANAGYREMPDPERRQPPEPVGADTTSLRDAASERSPPASSIVRREYVDEAGRRAPPDEAVTLRRAARDYADAVLAEQGDREAEGEERSGQPDDGEAEEAVGDAETAGPADEPLDEDIERALQHPQVRLAIEQKIAEAERVGDRYREGLAAAMQLAQVSFVAQFPELVGLSAESLPGALELMSRQDPTRFAQVEALIASSEKLAERQQAESRRQAARARQEFSAFAQREDERLATLLKGESAATRRAVVGEIMASAQRSGIGADELLDLFEREPLMRHAAFQHMMYDAAKYRLMVRARDAVVNRPLPPVMRPGSARLPAEQDRPDTRALQARLTSSGDLKDAVALYQARKAARP